MQGRAPLPAHTHAHARLIPDQYSTIEQVQDALRKAGLESSQLILFVDFTKVTPTPCLFAMASCVCSTQATSSTPCVPSHGLSCM